MAARVHRSADRGDPQTWGTYDPPGSYAPSGSARPAGPSQFCLAIGRRTDAPDPILHRAPAQAGAGNNRFGDPPRNRPRSRSVLLATSSSNCWTAVQCYRPSTRRRRGGRGGSSCPTFPGTQRSRPTGALENAFMGPSHSSTRSLPSWNLRRSDSAESSSPTKKKNMFPR